MTDRNPSSEQAEEPIDPQAEWRPFSERPAARPNLPLDTSSEPEISEGDQADTDTPALQPGKGSGSFGCIGIIIAIALLVVIIGSFVGGSNSSPRIQACQDAQNARSIANSASNERDRTVASMQYAVKKSECESRGGTVP